METIVEQLTADSVVEQVIELVSQAWKTERRGYHGEWVSSGGVGAAEARRMRMAAARNRQAAVTAQRATAMRDSGEQPSSLNKAQAVAFQAKMQADLENKAAQIKTDAIAEVSKLKADFEHEEHERRKRKILIEIGVTILGFIAAMIGVRYGVGEPQAIGIATAPFLVQPIIEFFKKV
jgi:hypothetical protein